MEWSIQQIVHATGTTSRTLRHYDDIGLVKPSRIGQSGYRYYDESALVRLQRVLLLRDLGLGLPEIGSILDLEISEEAALTTHLALLHQEQQRITRQIRAIRTTIQALQGGNNLVVDEAFDGFDHTQYKDEVEKRWGTDAYAKSDRWWRAMSEAERADWKSTVEHLGRDWIAAANDPEIAPFSPSAQAIAKRHVEWLCSIPGTPATPVKMNAEGDAQVDANTREYVRGLAEMYVADERFAANYGGVAGASFVRDALLTYISD